MAETTVEVVVRGVGFEKLAADAERATAAVRQMGAAARGVNTAAGTPTKQLADDMARVANGLKVGTTIGGQVRTSMASAIGNQSFWSNTFSSLGGRFKTFGQTLGRSVALGISGAFNSVRGMNGGKGPSETDLIGGAIIGGLAFKGVGELVEAASARQQARLNLAATKLVQGPQLDALEKLADGWSTKFGNISTTEGLNFLKDSLQIFGGAGELFTDEGKGSAFRPEGVKAMTDIAALMSYMKTYKGGEHAGDVAGVAGQIASMIRSGELKGLGQNPADLATWTTRLAKIALSTGVDPGTFLAAQRAAGSAFLALNDEGIAAFSTFVQENKQRAGVQLMTNLSRMIGGNGQTMQSNEMLRKLGIISEADIKAHPESFKLDKQGRVQKVYDTSLYKDYQGIAQNPYGWFSTDFYDGMRQNILKSKGFDIGDVTQPLSQRSKEALVDIIQSSGGAFGNRNQATMAVEAIIQAANIAKRVANQAKVEIDEKARNDSVLHQTQAFNDQLNNLKANLGESILPGVNSLLMSMNGGLHWLSSAVKAHQTLAAYLIGGIGGPIIAGGMLAGGMFLARLGALPFRSIFAILKGVATIAAGTGIGVFNLVGGGAAFGALAQTSARIAHWTASVGILKSVLGNVGKLIGVLSTIGAAVEVGRWAANTKTGAAMIDTLKKEVDAILHPGSSHGRDQLSKEAYWHSDKVARAQLPWLAAITKPVAIPSYLSTLIGDRAKYVDFAHNREWMKHIQPTETSFFSGRMGGPGARGGNQPNMAGGHSGPIPVVVQSMPKGADRPNNVTTNVTVNVQTNASPQAIGGAVGSAVGSKVSNALSDQHH